ncbi:MAG TPA: ATP-binding protein [Pseudonocardia sp.]|nr:ATP-binding protein [Pseudonocardia sp.]
MRLPITVAQDVFLARQRGREIAAAVGFVNQDQVRIATAISELGRELAPLDGTATITLSFTCAPPPTLVIEAFWGGVLPGAGSADELRTVEGIAAAARLVDTCKVRWRPDRAGVTLTRRLAPGVAAPTPDELTSIRTTVEQSVPGNVLDSLRSQNRDLLGALEDLRSRQEDLISANAELEETNRGVMALHAELSEELEETNRGVVALYAELDEATTRLREASESKTRFWSNVSHELRTPLNSVLGLSRLLLDDGSEPLSGEQRFQVELIRDSGEVLLSLVNELLDVAKAESGSLEAHFEPVDLAMVFSQLRASLRPLATNPGVTLEVDDPSTVPVIRTDPVLLGRILRNLLGNALKFTDHGTVHCHARVERADAESGRAESGRTDGEGGQLVVVVEDTGIGIPAEHQVRVFEEFYQVPGPAQTARRGTGLGLPYARKLAEILGGSLSLASEPGRGTTVTLRLPLDEVPAGVGGILGDVLLVDDDEAFRSLMKALLGSRADSMIEAVDGPSAMRALAERRPDLALLDLNLPAPDGAEILAHMRRDDVLRDVPVVVVTSAEVDGVLRSTLEASAVVLDKAHLSADLVLAAAATATQLARRLR